MAKSSRPTEKQPQPAAEPRKPKATAPPEQKPTPRKASKQHAPAGRQADAPQHAQPQAESALQWWETEQDWDAVRQKLSPALEAFRSCSVDVRLFME